MEFRMRDRVCYECADLHPVPLKDKCHIICSRKAVQGRIYKMKKKKKKKKKKQISEVSVDLFLTGAFAQNQATICNDNFDWSTE